MRRFSFRRPRPGSSQDIRSEVTPGRVVLIGGGPGEDSLITLRGQQLLDQADVVVADRLAPRGLLSTLREEVQVIDVGKNPHRFSISQQQINELLVEHARTGQQVVRLKGGDPYILGRGAEEREFCIRHGIEVEVVPGITSAIAVPAAVGIPLTHRGLSRGFTVLSAHEDLDVIPKCENHTLVILMGVGSLRQSATQLMVQGFSAQTPVAIVESGWTQQQRLTLGRLGEIADLAAARQVSNPAVIVIGEVVTLAQGWPDIPAPAAQGPVAQPAVQISAPPLR